MSHIQKKFAFANNRLSVRCHTNSDPEHAIPITCVFPPAGK